MDLRNVLRIIRRWLVAIMSVVLVTTVVLGLRLRAVAPIYEAQVKVQITAPQLEEIELFEQYRASSLRDEITVARNNFAELLRSREVYERTSKQLELSADSRTDTISTKSSVDSDFMYITVRASSPALAEQIANAQVKAAIEYYGEVRAKPSTATGKLLADQLADASKQASAADAALSEFQTKNNIGSLESELAIYQNLIQQLQVDSSRRRADGKDSTGIDLVIARRRIELKRLVSLQPQYAMLQEKIKQTHAKYQLLVNKYNEAELKDQTIRAVNFIQIVEPALAPLAPVATHQKLFLGLGVGVSLVLGVLLAFLLEYISSHTGALIPADRPTAPESDSIETRDA